MGGKYRNQATANIANGENTKAARKTLPTNLNKIARRKLTMIEAAHELNDLKVPPSNFLEKLNKDRKGQHSIRINDQYRICFIWNNGKAEKIEITDYH